VHRIRSHWFVLAMMVFLIWSTDVVSQDLAATIRLGDVARLLSDQDVATLRNAVPARQNPWLLVGESGQIRALQYVEAFLPPETTTRELRRGSLVALLRRVVDPAKPGDWLLVDGNDGQKGPPPSGGGKYAQVAVAGRAFDQIRSDDDTNRPFRISGQFDDDDLVRIAGFIRSNSSMPITYMLRQAEDSVVVWIRRGPMSWLILSLQRQGKGWVVVSTGIGQA